MGVPHLWVCGGLNGVPHTWGFYMGSIWGSHNSGECPTLWGPYEGTPFKVVLHLRWSYI